MTSPNRPPLLPEEDHTRPITPESATELFEPLRHADDTPPRGLPPVDYAPPHYKAKRSPSRNPFYLPLWSVLVMLFVVFLVAGGVILALILLGGPRQVAAPPPVITVIAVAPSPIPPQPETALEMPTLAATATITPTPLAEIALEGPTLVPTSTLTPTPVALGVGATVIVVAERLNIRSSPGTDNAVNRIIFSARQGQLFTIIDGPVEANGLRFWRIGDSLINIDGWAAENDNQQDLLRVFVP